MLKTKRKGKRNLKKNINNYKIGGNPKKKVTHKKRAAAPRTVVGGMPVWMAREEQRRREADERRREADQR